MLKKEKVSENLVHCIYLRTPNFSWPNQSINCRWEKEILRCYSNASETWTNMYSIATVHSRSTVTGNTVAFVFLWLKWHCNHYSMYAWKKKPMNWSNVKGEKTGEILALVCCILALFHTNPILYLQTTNFVTKSLQNHGFHFFFFCIQMNRVWVLDGFMRIDNVKKNSMNL